jgi:GT2 family glycosyltransferase
MELRKKVLKTAYSVFPFDLKGDLLLEPIHYDHEVSCIINFYGRINLLEGILFSLATQDVSKSRFEVILVEDRGGTQEGKDCAARFSGVLNIRYQALTEHFGMMGYSRNRGLSLARGKYILFLDDDTIILQTGFLSTLLALFTATNADGIIPQGRSSFFLLKGRYGYHESYYPTNRCMAYSREVLRELGGFTSAIIGQEDVEFAIRFMAASKQWYRSDRLEYLHPPLIVGNINKAASVGLSFAALRARYPLILWLLLLLNGIRYLPLLVVPFSMKWKMQGKFSLGFFVGILYSIRGKKARYSEN